MKNEDFRVASRNHLAYLHQITVFLADELADVLNNAPLPRISRELPAVVQEPVPDVPEVSDGQEGGPDSNGQQAASVETEDRPVCPGAPRRRRHASAYDDLVRTESELGIRRAPGHRGLRSRRRRLFERRVRPSVPRELQELSELEEGTGVHPQGGQVASDSRYPGSRRVRLCRSQED